MQSPIKVFSDWVISGKDGEWNGTLIVSGIK